MSLTCRKTRLATFAMWWLLALVVTVASLAAKPARALAGVDDYPANLKNAAQDALVDPWRFYNREGT